MKNKILNEKTKNGNKKVLIKQDNLSHLKSLNKNWTYHNLQIEKYKNINDVNRNIKDSYLIKKIKSNENKKIVFDLKDLENKEMYISNLDILNMENSKSENTINIPNFKKKKKNFFFDFIDDREINNKDINNAISDNIYIHENINKESNKRLKHKYKNNLTKESFNSTKKHCSKIWIDEEYNKNKDYLEKLFISINKNAQIETQNNGNSHGSKEIRKKKHQNEHVKIIQKKSSNYNNKSCINKTSYKKYETVEERNLFKCIDNHKNNFFKLENKDESNFFNKTCNNTEYDCIGFVCDEEYMCEKFYFDENHVESPDRIKCIIKALKEKNVINKMIHIKCREALFDEIKQCHSSRHINNIFYSLKKKLKYKKKRVIYPFDKHDTYYTSHTGIVSKRAIGGLLNLCDAILSDKKEKYKFIDFKKSFLYNYNFFKNVSKNNVNKYMGNKMNYFTRSKHSKSDSSIYIKEKSIKHKFNNYCENNSYNKHGIYRKHHNNSDYYFNDNNEVRNNDNNKNKYKENYINEKLKYISINHNSNNIFHTADHKICEKKFRSYSTSMFNLNDCNNTTSFTDLNCGFAAIRPPGHHCSKNNSSGFCIFNNISVACKYISKKYGIKKIFIFDWDVHHGNGTQEIFYSDKNVLCFSIHRFDKKKVKKKRNNKSNADENSDVKNTNKSNKKKNKNKLSKLIEENSFFPCTGAKNELGDKNGYMFNINVPLEKGYNNCDVYYVFKYILLPMLTKFQPEFIFISCGFDASINDPLGECNLTHNLYYWMTLQLKHFANIFCKGRIILVLEGGYNLNYLSKCTLACIKALIKKNTSWKQENATEKSNNSKLKKLNLKELVMNNKNNDLFETDISNHNYPQLSLQYPNDNHEVFLVKKKKKNLENNHVIGLDNFFNNINLNYKLSDNTQNNFHKLKDESYLYNKHKDLCCKDIHIKTKSKLKQLITAGELHYSTYKVMKYFSIILKGEPFHLNIKLPPYNEFIKKKLAVSRKVKLNCREIINENKLNIHNKIFDIKNSDKNNNLVSLNEKIRELNNFSQRCTTHYSESSTNVSNISQENLCFSSDETEYESSCSTKNIKKKVIILNRLNLKIKKDINNTSSFFPIINVEKKKKRKKISDYMQIKILNKNMKFRDLTNIGNDDPTISSETNDLNNSSINCDLTNLKYNEKQVIDSFKMYTKRKKGFIFFYGSGHKNQWVLPVFKKITKIIKLCSESEAYFYAWLYLCCKKEICIAETKENYSSILEDKEKIDRISISREFSESEARFAKQFLKFTVPCYYVFLKENQINELNKQKNTETHLSINKNLYDSIDVHTDKCISEILKSIHPIKNVNATEENNLINPIELIKINNFEKSCSKEDMDKKYMHKQYEVKRSFKKNVSSSLEENIVDLQNSGYDFLELNYDLKNNIEKYTCITDNEKDNVGRKRKKKKAEREKSNVINNQKKSSKKENKTAICLSNVLSTMQHPCVIDIKMGIRLYGDNCKKESIQKKVEKAKSRSCLSHGFHLTSLIGWSKKKKKPFFISKEDAHSIKNDNDFVKAFISYFLACDNICLSILLIKKILLILEKMKNFFENQNYFAFYGSSLLFVFDSDPSKNKSAHMRQKNVNQLNILSAQDKTNNKGICCNETKKKGKRKQDKNSNSEKKNYEEMYNFKEEIENLFEKSLTTEEKKIYMDNKLNTKILKSAYVYIIDFAHASLNKNEKDEGFLLGIISLHRILKKTIEKIKNFHLNDNFNL